ncbi:HPP family protein [Tepidibacter aestuarii]|uniref:HPP family protein n=1 Tax=Tepidibacter aestuarii TaxID=2925782 RepID=UPI0020BF58CC|nr:HPP family protein [Tepidibacter aestuarii]CAH2214866.1 CBS domain-containing membrane protein [Tepidibacter aestuarii]
MNLFKKMITNNRTSLKSNVKSAFIGFIGGLLTIFTLIILTKYSVHTWVMAPFGASCVLAFGVWNAPLSQPRNIIGGHFVSTFVGLVCQSLFGDSPIAIAFAVGLAIGLMILTKTTHPPAGADPLVVIMGNVGWSFLFTPVLLGSLIVVIIALFINNLDKERKYPTFWI